MLVEEGGKRRHQLRLGYEGTKPPLLLNSTSQLYIPLPCRAVPAGASLELLEAAAAAAGKASQQRSVPRSDSVLLVKNLPYSADEGELEALFGAVGEPCLLVDAALLAHVYAHERLQERRGRVEAGGPFWSLG